MTTKISSPIPDDLAKIPGVSSGFDIPVCNRGRYVITGKPGTGKSTLVHSNPAAFILDPEWGGSSVADPVAIRYTPPEKTPEGGHADAYLAIVEALIKRRRAGAKDIELIAIDTIDELIEIFLRDFCLKHKIDDPLDFRDGNGNAYTIVRKDIFGMLDRVHRAGFGWAILAHVQPKTIRLGQESRIVQQLAVSDSFKGIIKRKCEHMLFVERGTRQEKEPDIVRTIKDKSITIPGKTITVPCRVLKTSPGGLWEGDTTDEIKVRIPLENRIDLPETGGWDALSHAYDQAVSILTKEKPNAE